MWRASRKILGASWSQRNTASSNGKSWPFLSSSSHLLHHISSPLVNKRQVYSRDRLEREKSEEIVDLRGTVSSPSSSSAPHHHFLGRQEVDCARNKAEAFSSSPSEKLSNDTISFRSCYARSLCAGGWPIHNRLSSEFAYVHRRSHQFHESMAFFSSSSVKAAEKDNGDQHDSSSFVVEEDESRPLIKTPAPRRHPNLLKPLEKTPVPTPKSAPEHLDPLNQLSKASPKGMIRKGLDLMVNVFRSILLFAVRLPGNILYYAMHPIELKERLQGFWESVKHEANHYWVGTKLLWEEIKTARMLLGKTLDGTVLSRRERKQLLRTVSDLFRLIPFSMFIIIPFMEFALPFALRLFPNMLPSTYQDSLKAEENMKRELKSRIAMAQFFQETLEELAKEQKRKASTRKKELEDAGVDTTKEGDVVAQQESAVSMLEFLEKARKGESVPTEVIVKYATYFQDDLTLDNMPRMQLINMCRYMNIQPYGSDNFLRFQLRHKMRSIKEDDSSILWEGINSLTKMELREACRERGMRSTGLSKEAYKKALQQWLDLSVSKDIPIALLIMSRIFFLREDVFEPPKTDSSTDLSGLADAISGLDSDIVNEAILEVATNAEKRSDPEVRKIKLKVLEQQNELIRKEEQEREEAAKKEADREAAAKKEAEKEAAAIKQAKEDQKKAEKDQEVEAMPDTSKEPTPTTPSEPQPESQASQADSLSSAEPVEEDKEPGEKVEEEGSLSAEEMDAISVLWSDDPVSKERADLKKIKEAIKAELDDRDVDDRGKAEKMAQLKFAEKAEAAKGDELTKEPALAYTDENVKKAVDEAIKAVSKEAAESTKVKLDDHVAQERTEQESEEETCEDPIIARLKKRVESMVDKIEVQLSETQVKIGDKLHFLDKDKDGVFSKEEIAEALQTVLKRKISFEEAVEIANNMDKNADGLLTVDEFVRWIDEHKLVKFVQAGRDADMDQIMESHTASTKIDDGSQSSEDTLASGQ